jgi:8-oxo-dGTP pyrophosphatase MutT (NUDIX family)
VTREYCLACGAETVTWTDDGDHRRCHCSTCGARDERAHVVDPAVVSWTGDDGSRWHETAGVLVRSSEDRLLVFARRSFPLLTTIPAGHRERSETPAEAAARELREETGIVAPARDLRPVTTAPMLDDACRRGAHHHVWHLFALDLPPGAIVTLNDEGRAPEWVGPAEAGRLDLVPAVRTLIERHGWSRAS